jgi:hypothetical protein
MDLPLTACLIIPSFDPTFLAEPALPIQSTAQPIGWAFFFLEVKGEESRGKI